MEKNFEIELEAVVPKLLQRISQLEYDNAILKTVLEQQQNVKKEGE
ncbi:TPA: hypothetical protein ACGBG5_002944 [Enterococcus faecalis]